MSYLRRYVARPRRPRYGPIALGALLLASLLFAKVWETTVAQSLSMERDRLRREVRALSNRLRLSSELSQQAALKDGLDPQSLAVRGFVAPDPARIIDIDLSDPVPRALPRGGVAARFGAWLRRLEPRSRETAQAGVIPVAALPETSGEGVVP